MNRTAGIALATVLAAVAAGQDPRLSALAGRDEAAAERALRQLLLLPKDQVPAEQLLPLLASEPLQLPVVAVLARHGLATDRLAQGADLADAAAAALCLPFVAEAELAARLGNQGLAGRRRADALFALQDRGRLGDELLVQALADDDELLVRAAQAVFRHERAELPAGLLARLRRDRAATAAALAALAAAPRPSAQSFAAACAADAKLPARERLRALAAVGQPLDRAAAEFVLQSVAAGTDDGVRLALALVPPAVADQLVGRAQALLADGVEPAALAPLLERLTPLGELQLLGAAAALPEQPRDNLYRHLAAVDRPQFWQRVRAATDGEIPLEGHWLRYCGKLLDRPARVQRVLAVLRDEQAAQPLRERAFQALVTAHVYDPSLLAFAAAAADDAPFRQLLADAKDLPEPVFLQALQRPGAVALQAVTALERRALPPPLERELLALAQQLDEGDGPNGFALAAQACRTLAAQGSEAALQAVWALVRPRVRLAIEVLSSFTARAGPWIHPLLLAELARGARAEDGEERQQLLDAVRLELVELGDRRELEQLLANVGRRPAGFVRRCRHALPQLPAAAARTLLAAAPAATNHDSRVELVLWASSAGRDELKSELLLLWQQDGDEELQEAALRGLMAGPARSELVAGLRAQLAARHWDARTELLAYETVATMPVPLASDDLELLAALLLPAPLLQPDAELRRARTFAEGRVGFPMAQAIAERLRTDAVTPAGAVFAAAAAATAAQPDAVLLARQRLLCLWTALAPLPERQRELGAATAALLLAIPDARDFGAGAAHLLLAAPAEAAGDFAAAAAHWQQAARSLLRADADRIATRIFLGDRDPDAGRDPWSALAARPHLCQAHVHLAAGDLPAARAAAAIALDLAGRDATMRELAAAFLEQHR